MDRNFIRSGNGAMPPGTTHSISVHAWGAPPAYEACTQQQQVPLRARPNVAQDTFVQNPVVGQYPRAHSVPYATTSAVPPEIARPKFGTLGTCEAPNRRCRPHWQQSRPVFDNPYIGGHTPFVQGFYGQPPAVYPVEYAPARPYAPRWQRPVYANRDFADIGVAIEALFSAAGTLVKGVFCALTWPLRTTWSLLTRGQIASFWR